MRRHIDVWRPDTLAYPAAMLDVDDLLDSEDVVPGFAYPVAAVFADRCRWVVLRSKASCRSVGVVVGG